MPRRGIYAILDAQHVAPSAMPQAARSAFAGGAVMLQYRDKQSTAQIRRATAQALRTVARAGNGIFIINDDPALAAAVAADGVHLGRSDTGIHTARDLLGADAIIGATCHDSVCAAREAQASGANYVSFGRFFASTTKPDAPLAFPSTLTTARRELAVPSVAIGGINADNGSLLLDAGADLLAVSAALFAAADVQSATRQLLQIFN